jgi:predicted MFS family arabinose efflux permease
MMSFAGGSAIWAFLEQIGSNSHYSPTGVGTILAASLIFGVGGSFGVAAIGNRFGTSIPFAVAALAIVLAFWCIQIPDSFPAYAVGSCVFMIGWSACVPLAMGEIANLDGDGRFVTLLVPALGVGSMIGPGVSGWLYEVGSLADVLIFAGLCTVLAAVLMIVSERIGKSVRRLPATRG